MTTFFDILFEKIILRELIFGPIPDTNFILESFDDHILWYSSMSLSEKRSTVTLFNQI
jgi:hypothetical protein